MSQTEQSSSTTTASKDIDNDLPASTSDYEPYSHFGQQAGQMADFSFFSSHDAHKDHQMPAIFHTYSNTMASLGLTGETDMDDLLTLDADDHATPRKRDRGERIVWTPEEDNYLRMAVQLYGDKTEKWAKIAACVPGRTNKNCRKRWFHSLDPSLRKGAWTDEEDHLLRTGVQKHKGQWSKIAEHIKGRTDDQCAKRWRESLDPQIDRAEWTPEDDQILLQKFDELGSQWQKIALSFPGRPGLHCRNRWRKIQRSLNQTRREKLKRDNQMLLQSDSSVTLPAMSSSSSSSSSIHLTDTRRMPILLDPDMMDDTHVDRYISGADALHLQGGYLDEEYTLDNVMILESDTIDNGTRPGLLRTKSSTFVSKDMDRTDSSQDEERLYGCGVPTCNFDSASASLLFYHMKVSHPTPLSVEKPFKCMMAGCSKRYKNINGLQYHVTHSKHTTTNEDKATDISSKSGRQRTSSTSAVHSGPVPKATTATDTTSVSNNSNITNNINNTSDSSSSNTINNGSSSSLNHTTNNSATGTIPSAKQSSLKVSAAAAAVVAAMAASSISGPSEKSALPRSLIMPSASNNSIAIPHFSSTPTPAQIQQLAQPQGVQPFKGKTIQQQQQKQQQFDQRSTSHRTRVADSLLEDGLYRCPEITCQRTYPRISGLNAHMANNHGHKSMTMRSCREGSYGPGSGNVSEEEFGDLGATSIQHQHPFHHPMGHSSGSGSTSPADRSLIMMDDEPLSIDPDMIGLGGSGKGGLSDGLMSINDELDLIQAMTIGVSSNEDVYSVQRLNEIRPGMTIPANNANSHDEDGGLAENQADDDTDEQQNRNKRSRLSVVASKTMPSTLTAAVAAAANGTISAMAIPTARSLHNGLSSMSINGNSGSITASASNGGAAGNGSGATKRHICPISSCRKMYSTLGGLTYHTKNRHPDLGGGPLSLSSASTGSIALSSPTASSPGSSIKGMSPVISPSITVPACIPNEGSDHDMQEVATKPATTSTAKKSANWDDFKVPNPPKMAAVATTGTAITTTAAADMPYKCLVPGCGGGYTDIKGLQDHLLQTHGSTPSTPNKS